MSFGRKWDSGFVTLYGQNHIVINQDVGEYSETKASFQDESDINYIMRRFEKTGQLPEMIRENPIYGDFSNPVDYQEALNLINLAHEQFDALGAKVRDRFQNDPEKFLAFCSDPANQEEMIDLGLAIRKGPTGNQKEIQEPIEGETPVARKVQRQKPAGSSGGSPSGSAAGSEQQTT